MQTAIGKKIKAELANKGVSQRHLSKQTNIKYSTLNNMLNGRKIIDAGSLVLILGELSLEPNDVLDVSPRSPDPEERR